MRIKLTGDDTYDWATRDGHAWPASVLSGSTVFIYLEYNPRKDSADIVGFDGPDDVPADELRAIVVDIGSGAWTPPSIRQSNPFGYFA